MQEILAHIEFSHNFEIRNIKTIMTKYEQIIPVKELYKE